MGENYLEVVHDECNIKCETTKSKCWAKKGTTPIHYVTGSKQSVNIGGFYTEKNEFYCYDLGKTQNTESFLISLNKFKKDINCKIHLIIDKASWHTSIEAKKYFEKNKDWLETTYFPTAAPDRNPTEFCWKKTREECVSTNSFNTKKELLTGLMDFWKEFTFTHKISHYF